MDFQLLETFVCRKQKNIKQIIKIFKGKGLQIIITSNLKIVDYLDVVLNLNESVYYPFHKPNEKNNLHPYRI